MSEQSLNEDQRDALQEICNVGMGKAAAALATLLGAFVTLSVPAIRLVSVEQLRDALTAQDERQLPPVRQAFQSDISGEAIVMFGGDGRRELQQLMGYVLSDTDAERAVLCDIANLLVVPAFEACSSSLAGASPSRFRRFYHSRQRLPTHLSRTEDGPSHCCSKFTSPWRKAGSVHVW
jgi:chemotaxis protein CheY-P-specific phosphatase CheC